MHVHAYLVWPVPGSHRIWDPQTVLHMSLLGMRAGPARVVHIRHGATRDTGALSPALPRRTATRQMLWQRSHPDGTVIALVSKARDTAMRAVVGVRTVAPRNLVELRVLLIECALERHTRRTLVPLGSLPMKLTAAALAPRVIGALWRRANRFGVDWRWR